MTESTRIPSLKSQADSVLIPDTLRRFLPSVIVPYRGGFFLQRNDHTLTKALMSKPFSVLFLHRVRGGKIVTFITLNLPPSK